MMSVNYADVLGEIRKLDEEGRRKYLDMFKSREYAEAVGRVVSDQGKYPDETLLCPTTWFCGCRLSENSCFGCSNGITRRVRSKVDLGGLFRKGECGVELLCDPEVLKDVTTEEEGRG